MRYIHRPEALTAKGLEIEVDDLGGDGKPLVNDDGTPKRKKKPLELDFVPWALEIVLCDPAWRGGGNAQAKASLELKLSIESKLEELPEDWTILELTDEEHEAFSTRARATDRGFQGPLAALNRKFDRFNFAIVCALTAKPKEKAKPKEATNGTATTSAVEGEAAS